MWKEFKQFIMRGNVVDLAVGLILGAAFGAIVTSLVNDIVMPPIGLLLARVSFKDLFLNLGHQPYATLADARKASAPVIAYGEFVNTIISFLIIAFCVFLLVKQVNRFHKPAPPPPAPPTKECPLCLSTIPAAAKKCAHCTADLSA